MTADDIIRLVVAIGGTGVVSGGTGLVLVLTGRLVPVSTVVREQAKDQARVDAAEREADTWRSVAGRQTARADSAVQLLASLGNSAATVAAKIPSLDQLEAPKTGGTQ